MGHFRIGSLLGVEIRIDSSWFVLFFLILWTFAAGLFPAQLPSLPSWAHLLMGIAATLLLFASLVAHELSHSVVARARGVPVEGITLFIFGGMALTRREATTPGDEFAIAAVGPLSSFLLAAGFSAVAWLTRAESAIAYSVAAHVGQFNLLLAVFNLLPGFPLDGGRILRAAAWKFTGSHLRATRWAARSGRALGWLLIALGALQVIMGGALISGMWLIFIGWFLRNAARASEQAAAAQASPLRSPDQPGGGGAVSPAFIIPATRLPPGFAERVREPPAQPATPRPAATVVLLRDGHAGMEVLLLLRHQGTTFVPGAWVFAGGQVDAADADPDLAARARGLGRRPPAAFWMAAARELLEEAGVLLARDVSGGWIRDAASDARLEQWRERLMSDGATLHDVVCALDARLDVAGMVHAAHWITPIAEPRRYDTHSFLAALPEGVTAAPDPREMSDALWLAPAEALRRFTVGGLPMVFPTVKTLEALAPYARVADALDAFRGAEVRSILPTLVRTPEGVGIVIAEDSPQEQE